MSIPLSKSFYNMYKPAMLFGALFALLSVILGAFGAHYLKTILSIELLGSFETAVKYQMYHGLALLFTGLYAGQTSNKVKIPSTLFILGTLLFSGSIYALVALKGTMQIGLGGLGILTPIGGLLLIAAWGILLFQFFQYKARANK